MAWFVYVVECDDRTLYTGITNNLERRIEAHNAGRGARYTSGRGPVRLIHQERHPDRSSALRREAAIKRLPPEKKRMMVAAQSRIKPPSTRKRSSVARRALTEAL
ncbi:MAG: GIY-YIG nuclease family protein [Thermomicrobiales bacterium]